ncbi:MAG: PqqD family protein [Rectinemataceae bacterium]|nr:PqqD family protein [Rectinemataceae bacterium]
MIRLNDSVLLSRVDDEAVLLASDSGVYYGLNAVGSRMLELLTECGDRETAMSRAAQEYEAPADLLRADFLALLDSLLAKKLITDDAT